jgi:hypothetical protein
MNKSNSFLENDCKTYNIIRTKNDLYKLHIKDCAKEIYNLLIKTTMSLVKNIIMDEDDKSIYFSAESVLLLSEYLKKEKIDERKLIYYLTKQIKYYEENDYGFIGFNLDDIIVIDNDKFVIVSSKYLCKIKNNNIILDYLFEYPYFNNPEVMKIKIIPAKIDYKCSYYSLGCLITYVLLKTYLLVGNEILNEEEIEKKLENIKNTKIYWFLKRCLNNNYEKRELLLV